MIKGETIPVGEDCFNYTVKEPLGVVARIVAYNHVSVFRHQIYATEYTN
jgi:betaine-aldehyde dehydrogenase